ncbi:MAG: hypothetical protein ACRCYX_14345 [Dermatophilaceae bacterium]
MDEVVEKARQLIDLLRRKLDELTDRINAVLRRLPHDLAWVRDKVLDVWRDLTGKLAELWSWIEKPLAGPGNPVVLSGMAGLWHTRVGASVSRMVGVVDAGQLLADNTWEGTAAEAYKEALDPQKGAMEKIQANFCTAIADALDSLQLALFAFWVGVATAVATATLAVATAIVGVVGVITAPVAVGILVSAIGGVLVTLAGASLILYSQVGSAKKTLSGSLSDLAAYPRGHWPRPAGL